MRNDVTDTIINQLRDEIPQNMKEQHIPGLAIALVSKEGPLWCEGFGYTDMSEEHPINADALFSLQSTTKTVTTIAFLLAVEKGLVSLDGNLIQYYPKFVVYSTFDRNQYKKITFRHLLSHTSGLVREGRLGGCFNYDPSTFEEHIQSISGTWVKFPVGKGFSYSNAGMDLVAYALERISGKKYPDYVQEALGDPLGITFYYDTKEVYNSTNSAKGHLGIAKALPVDPVGYGCGVASLSIKDQAAFVKFLLNLGKVNDKQILRAEYINLMRSSDREGWYGLGTFIEKENGSSISYHPGGGFGLRSEMYWLPDYDVGVAVFTNQEYPMEDCYITVLARKAVKNLLEAKGVSLSPKFPELGAAQKIDTRLLQRLTGVYSGAWDIVSITFSDGKLYLDYPGRPIELTPHSETVFSAESRSVTFEVDKGNPISLKMYLPEMVYHMDYLGRPPDSPGPNKEKWKEVEGLYCIRFYGSEPTFCAVKIGDDGYLHLKWGADNCLYEHKDNVFFRFNGYPVVFEENLLYHDNIKGEKIDDPVTFMKELLKNNPERHDFREWVIDEIVDNLKYLGRDKEAERIVELRK